MARMTVAEKRRLAQEEALEWNNLRADYNQRLFSLASFLSETRDQNVLDVLWNLEYEFETYQKARDEENRRCALKQAALAKLNDEERELLGL